jgi:hypothetical protein
MANFLRKSGFRVGVQIFMVLLVVGMFLAACGGKDDPLSGLGNHGCPDNYTYCSGSDKCCPNGSPYHCSATGTCRTSTATSCSGGYDTCTG